MSQIKKLKREITRLREEIFALSCSEEPLAIPQKPAGILEDLYELVRRHGDAIEVLEQLSDQKDARFLQIENRLGQLEDEVETSRAS